MYLEIILFNRKSKCLNDSHWKWQLNTGRNLGYVFSSSKHCFNFYFFIKKKKNTDNFADFYFLFFLNAEANSCNLSVSSFLVLLQLWNSISLAHKRPIQLPFTIDIHSHLLAQPHSSNFFATVYNLTNRHGDSHFPNFQNICFFSAKTGHISV